MRPVGYSLLISIILLGSCGKQTYEKLIEAESFANKGGWVVDPQFVEQMGSPYLLAHGLGVPVADAETKFTLPAKGKYFVWVRTMNWAPGEWDAPGRFTVNVNGKDLKSVLGTEEGWDWQLAGKINLTDTAVAIKLKDLTGFDGRCDAIFLSTSNEKPPADGNDLSEWRKKISGESEVPNKSRSFDLVIVGGGIAGCAASIAAAEGTWKWEFSRNDLNQVDDAEKIRDHMLKAIYGSFFNAKKKPENANLALEWVSSLVGKRESRRLIGDYIYTFNDERKMKEFPDTVVMENRNIDVHYQQNLKESSQPDFLSEALYYNVDHYYVPYRSLYSKNIKNLLMAGRCFSCSHIGLGGPRVMNTTGQMGVAVGYAASLCKKYNTSPRGVYENHLSELLKLIGVK